MQSSLTAHLIPETSQYKKKKCNVSVFLRDKEMLLLPLMKETSQHNSLGRNCKKKKKSVKFNNILVTNRPDCPVIIKWTDLLINRKCQFFFLLLFLFFNVVTLEKKIL